MGLQITDCRSADCSHTTYPTVLEKENSRLARVILYFYFFLLLFLLDITKYADCVPPSTQIIYRQVRRLRTDFGRTESACFAPAIEPRLTIKSASIESQKRLD